MIASGNRTKKEQKMSHPVCPVKANMQSNAKSGQYNQPNALERLREKAKAGCLDSKARVKMLEQIEAQLDL
jgi:hypothetical protein